MTSSAQFAPTHIAETFSLPGKVVSCEETSMGLINQTFVVTCEDEGRVNRFILQAINSTVFQSPEGVMENILKVTQYLKAKDPLTECLELIPCKDGKNWLSLPEREIWRCYRFIENTETFAKIHSPELAYRAAAAFGKFQASLSDLPAESLNTTIPHFHHTPSYFLNLQAAAKADPLGRFAEISEEYEIIQSRKELCGALVEAGLPLRITHNDTKISNILFPLDPKVAPIVIDLDTVMPGLAVFDYGDLVRSAAASANEDEQDLQQIFIDPTLRKALYEGYLSTASAFLSSAEIDLLPMAPQVITLELSMRFLTDYLLGDHYFRITGPDHNLKRARNQLALLKSM